MTPEKDAACAPLLLLLLLLPELFFKVHTSIYTSNIRVSHAGMISSFTCSDHMKLVFDCCSFILFTLCIIQCTIHVSCVADNVLQRAVSLIMINTPNMTLSRVEQQRAKRHHRKKNYLYDFIYDIIRVCFTRRTTKHTYVCAYLRSCMYSSHQKHTFVCAFMCHTAVLPSTHALVTPKTHIRLHNI